MSFRSEVMPFIWGALLVGLLVFGVCRGLGAAVPKSAGWVSLGTLILIGYFLYFFRDPERTPPEDASLILAGADGIVARIVEVREEQALKADAIRISIFLTLFDVHVNRAPISGKASFLGYFPGKRFFTFQEKSSELNQHNRILIEGMGTRCLVNQIVGPVCRRVVYWLDHDRESEVRRGERLGMMKFGSRLDMYFPKGDVEVLVKEGDRVRAGETAVARRPQESAR